MKNLILSLFFLCVATNLFADSTFVSGSINGQIWTPSGSPYLVEGDLRIAGLIIEPGVQVVFLGDYVFDVRAGLTAAGTEQDSIHFY